MGLAEYMARAGAAVPKVNEKVKGYVERFAPVAGAAAVGALPAYAIGSGVSAATEKPKPQMVKAGETDVFPEATKITPGAAPAEVVMGPDGLPMVRRGVGPPLPPTIELQYPGANIPQTMAEQFDEEEQRRRLAAAMGTGGGGGQMVPGGWHPKEHEIKTEEQTPVSPEVRQDYQQAYAAQLRGLAGAEAGKQGMLAADAEAAQRSAPIEAQFAQQSERLQAAKAAVVGHYRNVLDTLHKEIRDSKVNPDRYWDSLSTGAKIRKGIGILLSGLQFNSAPYSNRVLDHIEHQIDTDNAEQLRQIEGKKEYAGHVQNAMQGLIGVFNDAGMASLALKSLKLNAIQQELGAKRATAQSAIERANLDTAIGQLAQKRADTELALEKLAGGKTTEDFKEAYKPASYVGPVAPSGAGQPGDRFNPSAEELALAEKRYSESGLPDLKTALQVLGQTVGVEPSAMGELMRSKPGWLIHKLNRAFSSTSGMSREQRAAFANQIAGYVFSGKALPDKEVARMQTALAAGTPEEVATTISMLQRVYDNRERSLGAGLAGYGRFSSNLRKAEGYGSSVKVPTGAPVRAMR